MPVFLWLGGCVCGLLCSRQSWGKGRASGKLPKQRSVFSRPWNSYGAMTLSVFLVDSRNEGLYKCCVKKCPKFLSPQSQPGWYSSGFPFLTPYFFKPSENEFQDELLTQRWTHRFKARSYRTSRHLLGRHSKVRAWPHGLPMPTSSQLLSVMLGGDGHHQDPD